MIDLEDERGAVHHPTCDAHAAHPNEHVIVAWDATDLISHAHDVPPKEVVSSVLEGEGRAPVNQGRADCASKLSPAQTTLEHVHPSIDIRVN